MGMEKIQVCVGIIPMHPHASPRNILSGDASGNAWGGYTWVTETWVLRKYLATEPEILKGYDVITSNST